MKRIPVFPSIIVGAAIAVMIALGFWQLGRMDEKEALIVRAEQALKMSAEVEYPSDTADIEDVIYRRTSVTCVSASGWTTVAGTSARGEKGVAQRVSCQRPDAEPLTVDIGWSRDPAPVEWAGGEVSGVIAPGGRIVATIGLAGLEPLAAPDPRNLPNNHLAYAGQWFFFALTALVIYMLALRRRGTRAKDE